MVEEVQIFSDLQTRQELGNTRLITSSTKNKQKTKDLPYRNNFRFTEKEQKQRAECSCMPLTAFPPIVEFYITMVFLSKQGN